MPICFTPCVGEVSRDWTKAQAFLREYYSKGLKLSKLEQKFVPDYNTTFELGSVLEWDGQEEQWQHEEQQEQQDQEDQEDQQEQEEQEEQ